MNDGDNGTDPRAERQRQFARIARLLDEAPPRYTGDAADDIRFHSFDHAVRYARQMSDPPEIAGVERLAVLVAYDEFIEDQLNRVLKTRMAGDMASAAAFRNFGSATIEQSDPEDMKATKRWRHEVAIRDFVQRASVATAARDFHMARYYRIMAGAEIAALTPYDPEAHGKCSEGRELKRIRRVPERPVPERTRYRDRTFERSR
jgi:hypothetical protein